ncbi:PH domain-containing protein [Curtobacterium ammoniigenes]|uniref:PH domain-containing protein n=1 Tax=Curtobacterium ammoniigenes TaxID=395387 RepID=UPI000829D407|nr:PH domain-containing protein [Curtobacterium ammoniigenes]
MSEPVVLRPRFGLVLCFIVWAIIVVAIGSLIGQGDVLNAVRFIPAFLLAAFGCWMLFWAPAVQIDATGVRLQNIARAVRISWPAVASVDTKYTLTIRTVGGRRFGAWSAPGPSRLTTFRATRQDLRNLPKTTYGPGNSVGIGDLPSSDSGLAALRVRQYWEQLRAAGHLDSGAVEGSGVETTWYRTRLIVLAVLAAATLAGALL